MIRSAFYTIISVCCLILLVGCEKGGSIEPQPEIIAQSATITKAELIDALWNTEGVEVSQDVRCIISSSFKITSETPFTIAKNTMPTDLNSAKVIVVSPITIAFDDASTDGRGTECGEGVLQYSVSASEETPIDIESATELKARHSLIHMVSGAHTSYPGCTIRAHFDKAGKAICDPSLLEEEEEEEAVEETPPEETPPPSDDDDDDDKIIVFKPGVLQILDDDEDDEDDKTVFTPAPGLIELKSQVVDADGVPCGLEEVQSVKMIVDEYNCQLQGFSPNS